MSLVDVVTTEGLAGDLDREVDRKLLDSTGCLNMNSRGIIHFKYRPIQKEDHVLMDSIPSSVFDLLQLTTRGVRAMIRVSILKGRVRSFESSFSSNNSLSVTLSRHLRQVAQSCGGQWRGFYQSNVFFASKNIWSPLGGCQFKVMDLSSEILKLHLQLGVNLCGR